MSPFFTSSKVTSFSPVSVFSKATSGVIVTNSSIASFVLSLLLESRYLPNFKKKIIIQLDSKYKFSI